MYIRLLDLVACPYCKGVLELETLNGKEPQIIIDGVLTCRECKKKYPIIEGIPRFLPDELMGSLFVYHRDFFNKYDLKFPTLNVNPSGDRDVLVKQKTLKSFSFQWNTFGKVYIEYDQHWNDFLPNRIEPSYFRNKVGLDVGCGFGRHILQAARSGAEMVGIDLSEAVKAAYTNTRGINNVHIIQGDIYNPPFKKGTFDFVYSLGVLHHLPVPEKGFDVIAELLTSHQEIFIWCYDNEKPKKNALYEILRRYSTRLDFRSLYVLTLMAALGVRIFLNVPAKILKSFGLKNKKIPYEYYLKYPLRVLHADLFDVFAVPSTKYYHLNELESWFTGNGLKILEGKHSVSGWTVYGRK